MVDFAEENRDHNNFLFSSRTEEWMYRKNSRSDFRVEKTEEFREPKKKSINVLTNEINPFHTTGIFLCPLKAPEPCVCVNLGHIPPEKIKKTLV